MAGGADPPAGSRPESARFRATNAFTLMSVDPGDVHCGVARFKVLASPWRAKLTWSTEMAPDELVSAVEAQAWPDPITVELADLAPERIDLFVVEEFRLYPWMAREQGYSDFKTARLIGKLEYLASRADRPLYLQGASVKKTSIAKARRFACDTDDLALRGYLPELVRLVSGRYDFVGRNQHVRDAIAHGWYWLLHHPDSPLADTNRK